MEGHPCHLVILSPCHDGLMALLDETPDSQALLS
jgi:hypothetical protein